MGTESVGAISTSEIINSELGAMEIFGFVQPLFKVSGRVAIERIMVEICQSNPVEKWVQAVSLSSNLALVARFWNSLM